MKQHLIIEIDNDVFDFVSAHKRWFAGDFTVDMICEKALANIKYQVETWQREYNRGYRACADEPGMHSETTLRLIKQLLYDIHHDINHNVATIMEAMQIGNTQGSKAYWLGYFECAVKSLD